MSDFVLRGGTLVFPDKAPEKKDVLVKGGDYVPDTVVGRDDVESWGGRVVIVPLRAGQSTTAIIEKLRASD